MRRTQRWTIAAVAVSLVGCATAPPPANYLIPVSNLVNSLKCEFAQYLSQYRGDRLRLEGWGVAGSIQLNIATTNAVGGGVEAGGIIPFQGTAVGFGFGAKVARKHTINTLVSFSLESEATSDAICAAASTLLVEGGLGFGDWLTGLSEALDRAAAGSPRFAVSKLNYELVFAVERSNDAKGSLTIVPLTLTASALASRNDVQAIKIELTPPVKVVGRKPDGTAITVPELQPFGERPSPMVVAPGT